MAGVESTLRSLLEGRRRKWTVIILIAALLLVLGLPAADDYITLCQHERELSANYLAEQSQLARREQLAQRASQVDATLDQFKQRGLTDETESDFRNRLVELTRGTGCQLRRLNLETASYRPWLKGDHPLKEPERGKDPKEMEAAATGFELRSQTVSLSVTGKIGEVQQLLAAVTSADRLMQTRSVSIRPESGNRNVAALELQFTVFGLMKAKRKMDAT